jgi:hypothetical protein
MFEKREGSGSIPLTNGSGKPIINYRSYGSGTLIENTNRYIPVTTISHHKSISRTLISFWIESAWDQNRLEDKEL